MALPDWIPAPSRRLLAATWSRRRPLAFLVGGVAVAAVAVSLLLPSWYSAECTILPPVETGESFGMMAGLIESSALGKLGLMSTSTPSDVFVEILRSRTLSESLVKAFDLERRYHRKGMDRTLKELSHHVAVSVNPAGVIAVRVEDRSPERAAEMANHLVSDLDRFNRETLNTRAKETRRFLEERLADVEVHMHRADSTLTAYEKAHNVVASTESIQGVADVIAQRLNLEVKRSYMSSYSRPGSPQLRSIDAEIAAFDREIGKLPALKSEGQRLAMDAEIQRKVFTLLTAQYEDARVQERRDTPTVTVLDVARAPEIKSRPKRSLIVLVSTALALLAGVAWAGLSVRSPAAE